MKHPQHSFLILVAIVCLCSSVALGQVGGFAIDEVEGKSKPRLNREKGVKIVKSLKKALEEFYYDPNFKGIDIDLRFKQTIEKIETLDTNAEIFRTIATLLLEFNDSHTRFYPPNRTNRVEYGFSMQMIGPNCYVIDVKKGSDAEKQGMKAGERLTKIGKYEINRDNLWVLNYLIYQLEPLNVLPVEVMDGNGKVRGLVIRASFKSLEERRKEAYARRKEAKENPFKCAKVAYDLTACKLRTFSIEKKYIEKMMDEVEGSSKMILDLRGNRGGYVKTEEYLVGHFFDREVKIGDRVYRKKTEPSIAKPVKTRRFNGELIVLVDSLSASASEVFSRSIQIEKRGRVVGDVTAGAVMTSYNLSMQVDRGAPGFMTVMPFGMNVTVADLIMSDGKRLEGVGVIPDHPVGPSAYALLNRTDPVLSFAAKLMGVQITPEKAGELNFLFKPIEDDTDDTDTGDSDTGEN